MAKYSNIQNMVLDGKEMKDLYIIFDQLPLKAHGGLVATYARLVEELGDIYSIKIVNIFAGEKNDIEEFDNIPIMDVCPVKIDNRFYKMPALLAQGKIKEALWAFLSAIIFLATMPIARIITSRKLGQEMVIASSPAAAMFLGKKVHYLLEVHTNFEYFWGDSFIGKAQSHAINEPVLTIFRNKADANKGSALFPSTYIYNSFDSNAASHAKLNEQRRPHSAIYVGRLEPVKNLGALLDCAEIVLERIPDFTLDIFGVGSLEKQLSEEISRRGLSNSVSMKGFTSDKNVYSRYSVFWLASTNEGFGLVLAEAMANKTPVITTKWGEAVSEIVSHGKTGYIAHSAEEFASYSIRLLEDESLRDEMGARGQADVIKRFSKEQNRLRWLEILKDAYPL